MWRLAGRSALLGAWRTSSARISVGGTVLREIDRLGCRRYTTEAPRERQLMKTYGVLHSNVRQLLRIIHPDNFRPYMKEGMPEASKFQQMSMVNQRSLQSLNAFNNLMKNHQANSATFLRGAPEPMRIVFHILRPLEDGRAHTKAVHTALLLPDVTKHLWVRHSDPTSHMHHWRDVQMLDLLNRVHSLISGELEINLLPSDQELEVMQTISRQTRIPMPMQCKLMPPASFESHLIR
jgi:hypothetical protein